MRSLAYGTRYFPRSDSEPPTSSWRFLQILAKNFIQESGCCSIRLLQNDEVQRMLCVSDSRQVAKLVVEFWPKEPGVYPCTVTLTSDVDIRIYQFEGMRDLSGS